MNFAIMFSTNIAIGCSTTNLMIRTWLIWKTNFLLRLLLVLLSLGHWALLTLFLATARASVINGVCTIYLVNVAYASAGIIYGILYDLVLLVFTIIGLLRMPSSSTLWKTLIKQGVIYFILNLVANVIILVLDRLNFDPIMNGIFATPAACICTIASSQVVLFLLRPSSNHESDSTSSVKVPPLTSDFVVTVPCSAGNCEQIDVVRRCVNK
jgi:multisubunit Na+/H+ antiporter MnhG subunit